jgi:hypothetical protein
MTPFSVLGVSLPETSDEKKRVAFGVFSAGILGASLLAQIGG